MKILMAMILLASMACAETINVNGKWKAVTDLGQGKKRETVFYFKAQGKKVTGFVLGTRGEEKITDGVLDDNMLRFVVVSGGVDVQHKCVVSGDRMFMDVLFGKNQMQMMAERIKE